MYYDGNWMLRKGVCMGLYDLLHLCMNHQTPSPYAKSPPVQYMFDYKHFCAAVWLRRFMQYNYLCVTMFHDPQYDTMNGKLLLREGL